MELFLAKLGRKEAESREEIYQRIENEDGSALQALIERYGAEASITASLLKREEVQCLMEEDLQDIELLPPKKVFVPKTLATVGSFTQLANEEREWFAFPADAPHDFEHTEKSRHTLPASAETGILLHKLLEKIPFNLAREGEDKLAEWAAPYLPAALESWSQAIASLLKNTLLAQLPIEDGPFCLADLPSDRQFREMPFIYPSDSFSLVNERERPPGFLKGVIDLIFSVQGKYYIADWKSNWLGREDSNYEKRDIEEAMQNHRYFLQAKIYREAWRRYLALVEPKPFGECFGGVLYFFLRGVDPSSPGKGIYYFQ